MPPEQPTRRLRVLVVDNNRDAAESLAMILDEHEVQCTFNGEAALVIAQDFHAAAVMLDIGLPGMSGYELARQLTTLPGTANAVLIMLSGFGSPADLVRSREAGCAMHFAKPVNPETLIDFLHNSAARLIR